jgi:hypothetical protein
VAAGASAAPMSPEFTRYALHLALGVGKHRLIVGSLIHFIG